VVFIIAKSIQILKELQYPSGLFAASKMNVQTGYNRAWIRDNIYEALGLEAIKNYNDLKRVFKALLDILLKHEYKIDEAIKKKPEFAHQYIHARFDPHSFDEIWDEWGNKQNDAVGALLFKIGDLEEKGIKVIRGKNDLRILNKLVKYLESIEYWHDEDNGMWEETEEVHASSVGACVAGLKKISKIIDVPPYLIKKGEQTLKELLPRESVTKETDLALLSLIYPYNVVTKEQAEAILRNVEIKLLRANGVIRYTGDKYYHKDGEAEWTMGLPWLAIIYKQLNKPNKYAEYMRKTVSVMNENGELPELYFSNTSTHNDNTPLGWSQALFLVMMED
jgi:phosphorylase kinase alpha/beta subunit